MNNNLGSFNMIKDTAATILICTLHAHMTNIAKPGTYNQKINKLLKTNSLPTVKLPDNPPSLEILNMASVSKEDEEETPEA